MKMKQRLCNAFILLSVSRGMHKQVCDLSLLVGHWPTEAKPVNAHTRFIWFNTDSHCKMTPNHLDAPTYAVKFYGMSLKLRFKN